MGLAWEGVQVVKCVCDPVVVRVGIVMFSCMFLHLLPDVVNVIVDFVFS